ncbi:MAG: hypothetical protein EU550_00445 [Promethearchaeota archaeon]|nr:MAG: hypothetical protein EU550_00445 [Candidatus Lokiarchaeota archaeon]
MTKKKMEIAQKLGIKNLIVEFNEDIRHIPKEIKDFLKGLEGINVYFRLNIVPRNLKEFKKSIRYYNEYPYIISIETPNTEIQVNAARDSRVDIISFSEMHILKTLSAGVISLTKQNDSFIEFSLHSIMCDKKVQQSKNFRQIYKYFGKAMKNKANILVNGNFYEPYHLRHPRSLISILNTLLDVPMQQSKLFFRENVEELLERVIRRNDKNFIENEVKLVPRD